MYNNTRSDFWHLSLFAARFGLLALATGYILVFGGIAPGGLGVSTLLIAAAAYLSLSVLVAIVSRGRELNRLLRGIQTLLDNGILVIALPHDPSAAMPLLFLLIINPLEFGVRYGAVAYRFSLAAACAATIAIVMLRTGQLNASLSVEAWGLLILTWASILYGLITVYGMNRLRNDFRRLHDEHQAAMRAVNFAVWRWELNNDNAAINPAIEDLLDVPRGSYDGRIETMLDYIHEDDREVTRSELFRKLDAKQGFELRFRRPLRDGGIRWLASRGEPVISEHSGNIVRITGVLWDITAELKAQRVSELALERVDAATRAARIGFWELDAATATVTFDANWRRMIKLAKPEKLTLEVLLDHVHADDHRLMQTTLEKALTHGGPVDFGFGWWTGAGDYFYLRMRGAERRDSDAQLISLRGVIEDYTERHENETQLKALRQRHDTALRAANVTAWVLDVAEKNFEVDSNMATVFGIKNDEFDGSLENLLSLVHEQDRQACIDVLRPKQPEKMVDTLRFRRELPDGSLRWIEARGEAIRDRQGVVTHVVGAAWDVTREMQSQQQTDAALAKLKSAAIASRVGFWTYNEESSELELDDNWRRVLGYSPDAPLPDFQDSIEYVHPDDRQEFIASTENALQSGQPLFHEYRVIRPDNGEIRHFQIRGDTVRDAHGNIVTRAGFIMDQTELVELRTESARIRTMLETAMSAITASAFTMRPDQDHIEFIGNIAAMMGLPLGTPLNKLSKAMSYIDPQDVENVHEAINHALQTGGTLDHYYRLPHAETGEVQWHHARGRVLLDEHGKAIGMIGIIVDETQVVLRRNEINELRQRYDRAMQAAGVGGWTWYVSAQTVELDTNLQELFGMPANSFDGTMASFMAYLHHEDRDTVTAELTRSFKENTGFEVRYRRQLPDGRLRWTMSRGEAVDTTPDGHVVEMAGATWDITELAELTAALERSNAELDEFAYVASHDLREPLRGLHNYAKFLDEDYGDKLDAEGRRMLAALGRLAQRLESLISDLLHFSRVGRTDLAVEETDLDAILDDVIGTLEFSLEQQGIDIRRPEPMPTIVCDRVRVGELFRNLITNATKYNDKDNKWIEIGHSDGVFHVRDNGIGIAPEHHEKVFTIFKRLHKRDDFGGGTGAGLTIVQRIVERHNGKVWLESEPGVGTTFFFTLQEHGPQNTLQNTAIVSKTS